jgi:phospholipid transport system substrate-binding protein
VKKLLNFFIFICVIFTFTQTLVADEQIVLKEHFLSKIDEVVVVVKNKELSKDERNRDIIEIVAPMFDFELMAKLSLGKKWKKLSKEDKTKFIELYVDRMKKSYSSKIDSYSDEEIEVKNIKQPKKSRIVLITDLVSKTESLEIIYKYHKPKKPRAKKDSWLVYDVIILGVSILKTDKAQFKEFLQTKKISELMVALAKK